MDPAPLVRGLGQVTNSYKHLFLRALLDLIRDGRQQISFRDLVAGMLSAAWWPGFHHRLSLGVRDQVVDRINAAIPDLDGLRRQPDAVQIAFQQAASAGPNDPLMRFVPQRLIRPWFAAETRGLPDYRVDGEIARLSQALFEERRPLYRIEPEGICLHPAWLAYLQRYRAFVIGWADAKWLAYLEARNSNVPGLSAKIAPDVDRPSLIRERVLWRAVLEREPVPCIYTGERVSPERFALDHFVPRTFVSHDRHWNLTPVTPEVNLAKSDHLPDQRFIDALAEQHARLAKVARHLEGDVRSAWEKVAEVYMVDLRLAAGDLGDPRATAASFHATHGALIVIAERMGFPSHWGPGL